MLKKPKQALAIALTFGTIYGCSIAPREDFSHSFKPQKQPEGVQTGKKTQPKTQPSSEDLAEYKTTIKEEITPCYKVLGGLLWKGAGEENMALLDQIFKNDPKASIVLISNTAKYPLDSDHNRIETKIEYSDYLKMRGKGGIFCVKGELSEIKICLKNQTLIQSIEKETDLKIKIVIQSPFRCEKTMCTEESIVYTDHGNVSIGHSVESDIMVISLTRERPDYNAAGKIKCPLQENLVGFKGTFHIQEEAKETLFTSPKGDKLVANPEFLKNNPEFQKYLERFQAICSAARKINALLGQPEKKITVTVGHAPSSTMRDVQGFAHDTPLWHQAIYENKEHAGHGRIAIEDNLLFWSKGTLEANARLIRLIGYHETFHSLDFEFKFSEDERIKALYHKIFEQEQKAKISFFESFFFKMSEKTTLRTDEMLKKRGVSFTRGLDMPGTMKKSFLQAP